MNKKILCVFSISLFALTIPVRNASASFDAHKMVGSSGSFVEKTVFAFNDPSPFLYMRLPANGQVFTGSFWRDPDATIFYTSTTGSTPDRDRWVNLTNWATVKKVGEWEVNSNYFYTSGTTGFGTANFTVTPEPMSALLFLTGGVALAAGLRGRKNIALAHS